MMRLVFLCALIATTRIAHAGETGMLPNGAKITWEKFLVIDSSGELAEPSTIDDKRFYLNFAHCACSKAEAGPEAQFAYEVKTTITTATGRPAEVWVGTACDNDQTRMMTCRKIDREGIRDIDALVTTPKRIILSQFELINVNDTMGACVEKEGDSQIWILVDTNGDGMYEYTTNISVAGTAPMTGTPNTEVTKVDTQEPPLPTDFNAQSGEGSIEISWDPPEGGATDIYAYQALCANEDGSVVTSVDGPGPLYQTTDDLCQLPQEIALQEQTIGGADGKAISAMPDGFKTLDPAYLCGEAIAATASSLSINGLENDKHYVVALLVMDQYGNPTGVYFNRTVVPKPVTDLWEDIHDRNSAVDGGCLLSQTYGEGNPLTQTMRSFRDNTLAKSALGRALTKAYYATIGKLGVVVAKSVVLRVIAGLYLLPLVLIALLWHLLSLPGLLGLVALAIFWRRLKKWLFVGALLAPSVASADDFQPYWDTEENDDSSLIDVPEVNWHAGIRLGPYIPEIDLQAGLNALTGKGPYEAMFGDYYLRDNDGELKKHERHVWQVLPMLDVDRIVWDQFGQITVGGSIGYMQKSAYTYLEGTHQDDAMRERSGASRNTFRLIPTAAVVGYRFTLLDDIYGIPIIPYVRGGLSYYMWWIKAPNGDVSKACEELSSDMSCVKYDKAYGGSFGFQGSIGIAVRAERIDADAAMSMRNSGLDHAGFYAELQYAKVDGFGSDSKLSVGDNTWFAGVNFEF